MSNDSYADPLDLVSVRLPRSLIVSLRWLADTQSRSGYRVTLSDALRTHISFQQIKTLGHQRPRRRVSVLPPVRAQIDPALMRQLAAIGGNVNQLARAVNRGAVDGTLSQSTVLLCALISVEREIVALTSQLKELHAH